MRIPRRLLLPFPALLFALPLAAQGIIIPGPCDPCRPGPGAPTPGLPVESVSFETRIEGQVATTHVTQVFRNETAQVMEGTYFFPIPEAATITEFAIWDGDRRLVGEVRPREEARRIYERIVRQIRDPGLLEYAGHDLFQARIFPIEPRSTKKLEIVYTQVLRADGGTVGYRYPLGVGRNASRVERLSGRVEIRAGGPLRTVYSPSHDVDVRRARGDRTATLSFEASGARAEPRDFQLFYGLSEREVGMSLFTYREPGRDGYFLLLLSPGSEMEAQAYAAKDVVFVLDVSGSMQDDDKMEKARRALLHGVRGLQPDDRFNVLAFSGDTRLMETGLVRADRAGKARGVEFVESLRARGGTNINDALVESLAQFPREGSRPRLLVFITDGLPTVGVTRVEQILQNVQQTRRQGVRLFSFGVGYDVNTRLLDRLAAENGGTAEYVAPREDLEVKVSSFFDKVNHPVLTNLRLDLGPVRTELVYPRDLPDLFRGSQVALVGRYRNDRDLRNVTARLTGQASPARTFTYTGLDFPLRAERHDFLPRLWATRRVGWLMEQIRSHGENRELRDEVVDLGTRFGIVTPYTSYLALEPGAEDHVVVQAEDFSGLGRRGAASGVSQGRAQPASAPVRAETGAAAVVQSRLARAQQDALSLDGLVVTGTGATSTVQHVSGRTFHLRDGVWTDAELTAATRLPVTELRYGSDEFHQAIRRIPALARYFALGEQVAVIHDGRVYRVRP